MLPISAREVLRFTPEPTTERPDPPTYLIAVPTMRTRARYVRDLAAEGAAYPSEAQRVDAMVADLATLRPEGADDLVARLEVVRDHGLDALDAEERAAIDRLAAELARFHGRTAALNGDALYYLQRAPYVALRHWLVGWEGLDAPFERRGDVTPDEVVERVPFADAMAAGNFALEHGYLSETQRKNSD